MHGLWAECPRTPGGWKRQRRLGSAWGRGALCSGGGGLAEGGQGPVSGSKLGLNGGPCDWAWLSSKLGGDGGAGVQEGGREEGWGPGVGQTQVVESPGPKANGLER